MATITITTTITIKKVQITTTDQAASMAQTITTELKPTPAKTPSTNDKTAANITVDGPASPKTSSTTTSPKDKPIKTSYNPLNSIKVSQEATKPPLKLSLINKFLKEILISASSPKKNPKNPKETTSTSTKKTTSKTSSMKSPTSMMTTVAFSSSSRIKITTSKRKPKWKQPIKTS